MAFEFSLSTVLRVRVIVEEREERLLQRMLFEITQTLEDIQRIDAEIARTDVARRSEILMPSIGQSVRDSYEELKALRQSRAEFASRLEKLEQLRDRQMVVYTEARRNREMLTDIREEKRNAYDVNMTRSEQKAQDDNYIARRGRM